MRVLVQQRLFISLWAVLFGFAWLALWLWQHSPYGRYLDHGNWTRAGVAQSLCASLPGGEWLVPLVLYTGGWLLMSAALMLPTAMPLVSRSRVMVHRRQDGRLLLGLLIGGYLAAWLGFGILAHLLDLGVHTVAGRIDWFIWNGWAIGAAVVALAGLFELSRLKDFCVERCRAPLGLVLRRWHGPRPRGAALAIGINHGLYCVGCCWALMLLMFVTGTASLGWMLILAAMMAAEKNLPRGASPLPPHWRDASRDRGSNGHDERSLSRRHKCRAHAILAATSALAVPRTAQSAPSSFWPAAAVPQDLRPFLPRCSEDLDSEVWSTEQKPVFVTLARLAVCQSACNAMASSRASSAVATFWPISPDPAPI